MSKIPYKCDRCGGHLTGGWEGRLHSAVIELNAAGCLGKHLGGGDIDPREHAAVVKCSPQRAVIN